MKTNQSSHKLLALLTVFVLLFFSCSSDSEDPEIMTDDNPISQDDDAPDTASELTLDEVLSRAVIEDYPATRTADTLDVSDDYFEDYEEPNFNGSDVNYRYKCTTKKLSVLDGNGKFPLFNPNAEVIWPGNLLQGNSLDNNTPSTINVDRAGGTVSYNLINGNAVSAIIRLQP